MNALSNWHRVTVVGCGLIGSSFALALRRACAGLRLAGWDASASVLEEALRRGHIDEVDEAFAVGGVSSSDLVYLAMPVGEIIEFLSERGAQVRPGAIITDAGSTKEEVCRAARAGLPKERRFVGGHPVAGSHLRGPAHARADLFAGASYVLTVDEDDAGGKEALFRVEEMVAALGARVCRMTAREHDRAMALVSHLPQVVASALASLIRDQPDAAALNALAGTGYRDWARLSGSSWLVWRDILATNPLQIADALDALASRLKAVGEELRAYDAAGGGREINDKLGGARAMFGNFE